MGLCCSPSRHKGLAPSTQLAHAVTSYGYHGAQLSAKHESNCHVRSVSTSPNLILLFPRTWSYSISYASSTTRVSQNVAEEREVVHGMLCDKRLYLLAPSETFLQDSKFHDHNHHTVLASTVRFGLDYDCAAVICCCSYCTALLARAAPKEQALRVR
eukprot:4026707-Amphidinium_carterae.1